MGSNKRLKKAKEEMKKLAVELSEEYETRPNDDEWDEIKEIVHMRASELKHEVYGENNENYDRKNDFGLYGHEERKEIYKELKNAFHEKWKKLREKIEKTK